MTGSKYSSLVVECYSGYAADERPQAIQLGARRIPVQSVIDRWYGEDHAYFKFAGEDGAVYLIRQDRTSDTWELILMESPLCPARQVKA
jgi:hypothetical protein